MKKLVHGGVVADKRVGLNVNIIIKTISNEINTFLKNEYVVRSDFTLQALVRCLSGTRHWLRT